MDYLNIIDQVYNCPEYTASERYFLFSQIYCDSFKNYNLDRTKLDLELFKLYMKISEEFDAEINMDNEFIQNRTDNLVLILTTQFLAPPHAPTIATLGLARYLTKQNKKIIIVNSAEMLGGATALLSNKFIPRGITQIIKANYLPELCEKTNYEYNGQSFPFFQFDQNMPNINDMRSFLSTIISLKPQYIVSVGGNSPLADAASKLVPVLGYGLSNSVCFSRATAQYFGRSLNRSDESLLKIINKTPEDIISGHYIYDYRDSGKVADRTDYKIDEDVFLIAVVGNRLTDELDEAFLRMLEGIVSNKINVIFIGLINNYDLLLASFPNLFQYSYYIGQVRELPPILSMCDIFVNPTRLGSGTAAVMALNRGLPVITTNYGDVATAAGEDFCVSSLSFFPDLIQKYFYDFDYYREMSIKAQKRGAYLTDSEEMYHKLFTNFEENFCARTLQ